MDSTIVNAIERIRDRINEACIRSGRNPLEIKIMAVTKYVDLDKIEDAWNAGIGLFGENRVQDGITKWEIFNKNHFTGNDSIDIKQGGNKPQIHLIGVLQRNKAKKAAAFFDCIQSVDRIQLIDELGGLTIERDDPLPVLLEYHTGEAGKAGFMQLDELLEGAEKILSYPGLKPQGLMTMAPFTTDNRLIRSSFRKLYEAGEQLKKQFPKTDWTCLSMGMSGDFEIAVEEGSTMLRIGTGIFNTGSHGESL